MQDADLLFSEIRQLVWEKSGAQGNFTHVFSMGLEVEGGTLLPGSMGIEPPGTAWPGWVGGVNVSGPERSVQLRS